MVLFGSSTLPNWLNSSEFTNGPVKYLVTSDYLATATLKRQKFMATVDIQKNMS